MADAHHLNALLIVAFLISGYFAQRIGALPLIKGGVTPMRDGLEVPPPEILRFMRRFGYLESNPNNAEALYHESAIIEAIKNVQKYGALNQTGRLDNETLELFTKPRCGVPDLEGVPYYLQATTGRSIDTSNTQQRQRQRGQQRSKRYVIGAKPWTKRRIRYFIANWSLKITATQVERDIARAFDLWSRYSGLQFVRVNNTAADIIVGFGSRYHGDNYPFDGPGNILAHAYYPYEMGSWGGDLHFDEDENWQQHAADLGVGVDFYAVAVHELGHSLGLAHSPVYNSIMFPYYKGAEHVTLDADDTRAMYEMYLIKELKETDEYDDYNGEGENNGVLGNDKENENNEETTDEDNNNVDNDVAVATTAMPRMTEFTPTFQGDYETVTQHKSRYGPHYPTTTLSLPTTAASSTPAAPVTQAFWPPPDIIPNICEGHFDAVTVFNGAVHIFKGAYVWRLTAHYTVEMGSPKRLTTLFPALPVTITNIDAAYKRLDGAVVIFAGTQFWVFNNTALIEDSPQPLAPLLGNATDVDCLDAAMIWPKNNFTYLFAGAKFWRYDAQMRQMHDGYPKSMQRWPGIPYNIDAAATLTNGKTYFFKHKLYWLYNNAQVRPERGYPRRAPNAWLGCARPTKTVLRNMNTTVSFISSFASTWRQA